MIELIINSGEIIAIGLALIYGYRNSFLWLLFAYVCTFTLLNHQLFQILKPDVSYSGHTSFYFIMAIIVCLAIVAFSMYRCLTARILTAALCIQALSLFTFTVSGMEVYSFTIPQSEILNHMVTFVNVNILMFETIIAWIVATRRKG